MKNLQQMINEGNCPCERLESRDTRIADRTSPYVDLIMGRYKDFFIKAHTQQGDAYAFIKYCPFCGKKLK
jgi:hypothetical protein